MLVVAVKLVAVALVLAGGLVVAARQTMRRGGGTRGHIRVQARHGLSRTALVAVVEVDGRRFLIGSGDTTVTLLTELDAAPEVVDPVADAETTTDAVVRAIAPTNGTPTRSRVWERLAATYRHSRVGDARQLTMPRTPHRTGHATNGPRIGPIDRLREMTVRSRDARPIHAPDR